MNDSKYLTFVSTKIANNRRCVSLSIAYLRIDACKLPRQIRHNENTKWLLSNANLMQNILQWALGASNMWARKENKNFQTFGRNIENSVWNVSPENWEFTVFFYSIFNTWVYCWRTEKFREYRWQEPILVNFTIHLINGTTRLKSEILKANWKVLSFADVYCPVSEAKP